VIDSSASDSSVAAVPFPSIRPILWHRRDQTGTQRTPSSLLATPRLTSSASPGDRFLCVVFPRLCGANFRLLAQSIYTAETKLERREYLPLSLKPLGSHPPHHSVVDSSAFYFPVSAVPPSVYSPNPLAPQRPNRNAENTFYSAYPPSVPTCTHQPPEHRPLIGVLCVVFSRLCGALSVYSTNPFAPQRPNRNAENTFLSKSL